VTRAEHLAWCKQRALAYVDRGELLSAISSMLSDLGKHEETQASVMMGTLFAPFDCSNAGDSPHVYRVRQWIEGFN
jgi:hypothetical protein